MPPGKRTSKPWVEPRQEASLYTRNVGCCCNLRTAIEAEGKEQAVLDQHEYDPREPCHCPSAQASRGPGSQLPEAVVRPQAKIPAARLSERRHDT